MQARLLKITGDVQGVSYRYFARTEAKKLGLSGWAKNEHDGTVSVLVQGEADKVAEFIEWSQEGSPMAQVDSVDAIETELNDKLERFEVK